MIDNTKYFFFQFSQGSYSDYGVGGLYVCDHEIADEEWDNFYKVFSDECERLANLIPRGPNETYYTRDKSPEMKVYQAYRDQSPEEAFQKLHNMVEVPCQEFWRD